MTLLFRKRKAGQQGDVSKKIVEWLDNRLRGFAAYLSRKTEGMSPKRMAVIIMAACFFFSVCLGITVVRTTRGSRDTFVPPIQAPLIKASRQRPAGDVVLQRIRHFHQQLDSLRQNDFICYDSLMKSRPHLLDSILTAEQLLTE